MTTSIASPSTRFRVRVVIEIVVALIGIALLTIAVAARQPWLDRHFLPSFILPRSWYVRLETTVRIGLGAFGAWLAIVARPRIGRLMEVRAIGALTIAIAAVLALAASELVLRRVAPEDAEGRWMREEPRLQADPRLGWTWVPARTVRSAIGGRLVEYTFDRAGYRVRRSDEPVDPERPTLVFTGESVMFGEGLTWEESIPAQVGASLGIQSANMAVRGFATDQAYLRLQMELPRFRRPVGVVSLFMTSLFGRNLESERPHLGPALVWLPPVRRWRVASLARLLVFYHGEAVIERGIAVTREVLRATAARARARGAAPLVVVPQLGPEAEAERALRHRVFDGLDVPWVLIEIDPAWHLPWNRHPNARAARAIAAGIVDRLRRPLWIAGVGSRLSHLNAPHR